jgi:hypothetical protein
MRKLVLMTSTVLAIGMAVGLVGCSSSPSPSAAQTAAARKTAFCRGNIQLDKASANVNSLSGFVTVLKKHKSAISTMDKNLPPGTLGTEARQMVSALATASSSGNTNALNNVPMPVSGDVDTYCGVAGNGTPLPAYFATGKGSTFCTTFLPIYDAVSNATSPAGVLAVLVAHKTQIAQAVSEVSGLPSSIKASASAVVTKAQAAITENSASNLGSGNGNGEAELVALYCGQNQ